MAAAVLAIALSLMTFLVARDFFGDAAGLVALAILVFDPKPDGALRTGDHGYWSGTLLSGGNLGRLSICEAAYALAPSDCDGTAAGDQALWDSGGPDARRGRGLRLSGQRLRSPEGHTPRSMSAKSDRICTPL
jgi:hypothetical protein